jgi:CheY-like chemotaxis protein
MEVAVSITFEQAVFGDQIPVEVRLPQRCDQCNGSGAGEGTQPVTCVECSGSGQVRRVRQSVLKRTFIYAKDFKDYLQYKAVETAEAVLQEAAEYVLAKEHEAADILRKIDDIEKNLALVYKETSSILAAVSSENNAFSSVQVIPFLKVFEETKPNIEELSVHTCEKNQQANNTAIKRSVLLAEEDAVIAKLLASTLEREGFSVTLVNDGKEALRLINAATLPDIAMLDFMLPYVGGLQLL